MTRKNKFLFLGLPGLILLIGLILTAANRSLLPSLVPGLFSGEPHSEFIVVAHRGASQVAPENTIAAFQAALDIGANGMEADILFTKDSVPVAAHHDDLSSYTNIEGSLISEMTLAQVKEFDVGSYFSSEFAGERVPTLEEMLDFLNGKVDRIYLHDKKENDYSGDLERRVSAFADVIRTSGMTDKVVVMVESCDLSLWKKHAPDINLLQCWAGYDHQPGRVPVDVSYYEEGVRHLGVYRSRYQQNDDPEDIEPTIDNVSKYPDAEFAVFTVNEKTLMKAYIDAGFKAVGTDNPALLLEVLEEQQQPGH